MENSETTKEQTGVEEGLTRIANDTQDLADHIEALENRLSPYLHPSEEEFNEENYEMQTQRAQTLQDYHRSIKYQILRIRDILDRFDG